MKEEKRTKFDYDELLKYRELAIQNMNYSVQRIDILIIALCTSGIIFATNTINSNVAYKNIELKIALLFFVLSILINLTSQFFGYHQNRRLVSVYDEKVVDFKNDPTTYEEANYESRLKEIYAKTPLIHTLNILSFIFLIIGMISCLLYYYCPS